MLDYNERYSYIKSRVKIVNDCFSENCNTGGHKEGSQKDTMKH